MGSIKKIGTRDKAPCFSIYEYRSDKSADYKTCGTKKRKIKKSDIGWRE